ncbi:MAG TPA: type IV toxin-antitoxin system AbiEi family antitoxin [Galbitalea sp.]
MPLRLSSVLSRADFPYPELTALVLDGEAFRVDDCVAPVDQIPGPLLRAAALAAELPARLIAEQHSAAWIWGALDTPPARHEVCADITARIRPAPDSRLSVREVVVLHEDVTAFGGLTVTTPMRTAIDLTRFVVAWNDEEQRVVRELLILGECSILDCARVMNRKRNLPNKKIALERLAAVEASRG